MSPNTLTVIHYNAHLSVAIAAHAVHAGMGKGGKSDLVNVSDSSIALTDPKESNFISFLIFP